MDDETEAPIDALEVEVEAEAGLGDGASSKTLHGGTSSGAR